MFVCVSVCMPFDITTFALIGWIGLLLIRWNDTKEYNYKKMLYSRVGLYGVQSILILKQEFYISKNRKHLKKNQIEKNLFI